MFPRCLQSLADMHNDINLLHPGSPNSSKSNWKISPAPFTPCPGQWKGSRKSRVHQPLPPIPSRWSSSVEVTTLNQPTNCNTIIKCDIHLTYQCFSALRHQYFQ